MMALWFAISFQALMSLIRRLSMNSIKKRFILNHFSVALFIVLLIALISSPAVSEEYNALNGVKKVKAVFDVSMGSPQITPVVFWAVRNVYDDESVRMLPESPAVAVVFHGQAVKLISTNRDGYSDEEKKSLDEFAGMIKQMKQDGVKLEVCKYALKVLGVNPESILPEIDQVGNGFISVVGYQSQGYSVVTLN
jgi:uncharacterized protein